MGSDAAWAKWGEVDPYFGVLTLDEYHAGNNREMFFTSGQRKVAGFIARYEQMFGPLPRGRALDFGCGVGRLSLALAREFDAVTGIDIAPAMLAEAQSNADEQGLSNVDFVLSDDGLTRAAGPFDLVFSYIVIQHIPVDRGMAIIDALLDRVKPGGGAIIHIATLHFGGLTSRAARWARQKLPGGGALVNIARGRPAATPVIDMNEYDLPSVIRLFEARGMDEIVLFRENHGNVQTVTLSARRPD